MTAKLLLLLCVSGVLSQFTVTPPPLTTVNEGDDITFHCAYINATSITWLRENVSLEFGISGGPSESNLTFVSVNRTVHNTSFSCQATTPSNTTQSTEFELLVYYIDTNVQVSLSLEPSCSQDTTIYDGSTVILTCTAPDAYPAPRLSWLHNNEIPDTSIVYTDMNQTLRITGISSAESGVWVCQAVNEANIVRRSEPREIGVRSLFDRSASIEPSNSEQLVKRNADKELRCVFDPPLFQDSEKEGVRWTVDGSGIAASSSYSVTVFPCFILLTIRDFADFHTGTYRCQLSSLGLISDPVVLTIATIRQTYSLTMHPSSPIGAGREVTFTCTPEGAGGNVMETLFWRFTNSTTGGVGRRIESGERGIIDRLGQRLVVSDLQVEDSGLWSCVAFNELAAEVVTSGILVVEAPPQLTVSPATPVVVKLGTPLTLYCVTDSRRDNTFSWIVGGATYRQSSAGRFTISSNSTSSTLTLVTVEEAYLGNVSCVALDPIHLPVVTNTLLIEASAFYLYGDSATRNVTLMERSVFRLDCDVRGGGSGTTVIWFRGREVVTTGKDGFDIKTFPNGTSSLLRSEAFLTDDGTDYSCKAEKNELSHSQQFNIFISIPSSFTRPLPSISNATLGQRFQMDCLVTGRPLPVIEWRFRSTSINNLNLSSVVDLGNGSVVFSPVQRSHAGQYACVIVTPTFLVQSTMLTVQSGSQIMLNQNDIILITMIVIGAVILLVASAILGIFCTKKCYKERAKTSGHYDVHQESVKVFERQPSLRDRKDNSGILSSSPSNDIFDALQKSPEASGTFRYSDNPYSMNPTALPLDMFTGGMGASSSALSEKLPPTSYNSTPLHGTMASTSMLSSDDPTSLAIPNYPRTNLELGDVMGEGEFGPVVLGVANYILPTQDKTLVAVKVLVMREEDEEMRPDLILMDFANQMKLTYTNVASILGICSDVEPYYVIYEYLDQGDLKKFLEHSQPEDGDPPTLTPADMRKIILQVADGMAYLFSQRIIHGDLATRNCLVSSTLEIKIADLGIGHDLYHQDYYDNGSQLLPVRWMPPELLQEMTEGPNFSLHSDIWSFGVFCWEVFAYARLPYDNFEDVDVLSLVPAGSRLRKPSPLCPHALYDLMCQCWSEVPDRRPQFARLCVAIVGLELGEDQFSQ